LAAAEAVVVVAAAVVDTVAAAAVEAVAAAVAVAVANTHANSKFRRAARASMPLSFCLAVSNE
jgi:hypothetical protein